jgi:hypothetical protein
MDKNGIKKQREFITYELALDCVSKINGLIITKNDEFKKSEDGERAAHFFALLWNTSLGSYNSDNKKLEKIVSILSPILRKEKGDFLQAVIEAHKEIEEI